MRPIVTDRVAWSVGLSVMIVRSTKTAEPIKMPFRLRPRKNVIRRVTFAPPGEYSWSIHVRQRCGLLSNYFDPLLLCCCCRAEKIVNTDDEPHTESSQELQRLMDTRVKCCGNLAAAQIKVVSIALYHHPMHPARKHGKGSDGPKSLWGHHLIRTSGPKF